MTTGEKIRDLRKRQGLSQEALAGQLGLSRQAVSRWENENILPETETVLRLSALFQVSTDYLLKEEVETPEACPDDVAPPRRSRRRAPSPPFQGRRSQSGHSSSALCDMAAKVVYCGSHISFSVPMEPRRFFSMMASASLGFSHSVL